MPVSLKDQVALVVGASSGIGRAVAVLLARNGASAMAAACREDRLRALKAEMAGHLLEICCADATSVPDVERLVAETRRVLGPIGIMVYATGTNTPDRALVRLRPAIWAGKLYRTPVEFKDDAHLLRIIEKIVSRVGRRVDESSPLVDARLPDGSRVNAAIPPVAVDGPLLSIRRFGRHGMKGEDLVTKLSLTTGMLDLLKACVKARLNILISGGTGSGKTTLLNALSAFIPEDERIVTIEDAAELRLQQTHVARMETRPPNVEGVGAIHIRQLVINALRMRPDRIIVGEVRGEEALDMLQAMNTGHDGSLTTIHANTPRDGLGRLEVMVGMANANMGIRSVRQQIASAVDLFVQTSRFSDGTRRITHITEVTGMEQDTISLQDIFLFEKTGIGESGRVVGRFRALGVRPKFCERLQASGITLPMQTFQTVVEIN